MFTDRHNVMCLFTGCDNAANNLVNCDYWSMRGECSGEFIDFMNQNCPRSCDTCTGVHDDLDLAPLGESHHVT